MAPETQEDARARQMNLGRSIFTPDIPYLAPERREQIAVAAKHNSMVATQFALHVALETTLFFP